MAERIFRLISKYDPNNVLTVKNSDVEAMAPVQVWTNRKELCSAWFLDNKGYIHNLANADLCLATVGVNRQSGSDTFRDVQVLSKQNAGTWQLRDTTDAVALGASIFELTATAGGSQ